MVGHYQILAELLIGSAVIYKDQPVGSFKLVILAGDRTDVIFYNRACCIHRHFFVLKKLLVTVQPLGILLTVLYPVMYLSVRTVVLPITQSFS